MIGLPWKASGHLACMEARQMQCGRRSLIPAGSRCKSLFTISTGQRRHLLQR